MFNRLLTLIAGILFSFITMGQTNYIDVNVNDTVLVQADQFIYRLNITEQGSFVYDTVGSKLPDYYVKRAERVKEKQRQIIKEWQDKIKAAGFTVVPLNINDASMRSGYENQGISVYINSVDSLKRFVALIKNEKTITGSLLSGRSKNEETYFNELYKKLLKKARIKAEYLALISKKKVLSVIGVTAHSGYYLGGWNSFSSNNFLLLPPSLEIDGRPVVTIYSIQNNLVVRFSTN